MTAAAQAARRPITAGLLVRTLMDAGAVEVQIRDGTGKARHPDGLYITLTCMHGVWRCTIAGARAQVGPLNLKTTQDLTGALDAALDAVRTARQ